MQNNWHSKTAQEVSKELSVSLSLGLSSSQANELIEKYGYNELKEKEKQSLFQKIIAQFKDFLVIILIAASVVSAAMGETTDSIVIIAIVIINAILGVMQEGKAEKALDALKKMASPNAKVFRDGKIEIIPAKMLVPGDIIVIEAGDVIPADIRIIESHNLKVEESSLTGESVPVEKDAKKIFDKEVSLGDRANMAYMSTTVSYGRGKGIVVGTGHKTEIGKIADKIQNIEEEKTPLQQKLDQLGKWLGIACLGICAVVFALGIIRGGSLIEMFMVAVSLAVAAIPEGLPAVVTIVLALGMKRMVERNAIVRKLLAVETLGCVDVICSDKTGTLTQNEMTVVKAYCANKYMDVTGQGYNPSGEFIINGEKINAAEDEDFKLLFSIGTLCNDASIKKKEDGQFGIVGDPTEGALVVAGEKAGFLKSEFNLMYPRIAEIPFDSDRKMMTTFHKEFIKGIVSFTKGAPDIILERCSKIYINGEIKDLTDEMKKDIKEANSNFANSALRVLAFAYREYDEMPKTISSDTIEKDMIFVGLMGMIDPPRTEVKDSINICRRAGIKPVMITGDYKDTAVAIAKDLKLMNEGDGVLTGHELDNMSDEELIKRVETTSVYARVSPEHKVRIVDALKKNGHIAAMTGDGVNDAMALKRSDIGVAMGITGTDVAKGTADIVLTDDNFSSIVSAVEEGRIIYSNIRKFVFFLLSCNVGEILIVFLSMLFGYPTPLVPIQLLWLNLVTDSFPALALGTEKGEPDIMDLKPRNAKEPILDKSMITGIAVQSIALVVAVLGAYFIGLNRYPDYLTNVEHLSFARTYAFATLITAELIRSYSSRSERFTIFKIGVFTNKILVYASIFSFLLLFAVIYIPFLRPIFQTVYLTLWDWTVILIFCSIPFISGEVYKVIKRKLYR
ncbi:Ca2+-transporting ATPase [Caloramator quimbayensis]|uniref:P-type Ca(2+) transporter n=1 Tax=Caloramator quimbayensis TaxID=1147123 RepID=A0A1T4WJL2_9CLOT|nr:calcium-translocating P-type ATPase, SERCA-type [Caloramator quimbayensis]SKA77367.1 Ca2+-transporting ATPase [Caloramator quimbayensis]